MPSEIALPNLVLSCVLCGALVHRGRVALAIRDCEFLPGVPFEIERAVVLSFICPGVNLIAEWILGLP